jgi:hypothetical protein
MDSMKEAGSTSAVVGKPPVYRHAPGESLGGIASEIAMKRSLAVVELYAERNVLKAAAWRPVTDLLHQDPAAREAARKVIRIDRQISDLLSGQPAVGLDTPPVTIGPGDQLFFPPYDHAQVGTPPELGAEGLQYGLFEAGADVPKDRQDGLPPHFNHANVDGAFEVDAFVDPDYDGVFHAVVGLGLDLETSKPGSLELRPLVTGHTWWFAHDMGLSSYVEGDVTLTVLDSTTQAPVISPAAAASTSNAGAAAGQVAGGRQAVASFTLFSQPSEDGPVYHSDVFSVTGDQLSLTVDVQPGTPYQVWVHLYIVGNQSGQGFLNSSFASAYIQGSLPFIVAQLHT